MSYRTAEQMTVPDLTTVDAWGDEFNVNGGMPIAVVIDSPDLHGAHVGLYGKMSPDQSIGGFDGWTRVATMTQPGVVPADVSGYQLLRLRCDVAATAGVDVRAFVRYEKES